MAEPARSAAGAGPDDDPAPSRPGPVPGGWDAVQRLMMTVAGATGVAVSELAARPRCAGALRRADALRAALEDLADLAAGLSETDRRREADEAVHAAELARAYRQGMADCKAARCRLEVIDGGAGPAPR